MSERPIALAGIGKIARDQHVPALADSPDWHLAATVSRNGTVDGVQAYTDIRAMLEAEPSIATVSLALPPVPRFESAMQAIAAGRHVMLEKPPGATLSEVHALERAARDAGVCLFATWHSREAAAVAASKAWLADKKVTSGRITWHEDVRRWHPGQDWVFEAGGMGVFDPGINALSILTEIMPAPVHLLAGQLLVPSNRQTPIAARLSLSHGIEADFDWRADGDQNWTIELETGAGALVLTDGGARGEAGGEVLETSGMGEYPGLYARMARLVKDARSDVDLAPMVLVADAMTLGRRTEVDAFDF